MLPMRIADSTRFASTLQQITRANLALARATDQVSSGRRYATISDNPTAGREVLDLDSALRGIAQYRRTAIRARERLNAEESSLSQVSDILARAKELATSQGGSGGSTITRRATAAEVSELRKQVIALGNLSVGGEFIFGGMATESPPFDAAGVYSGTAAARESALAPGITQTTTHSGQEMLVDTGVLDALTDLEAALTADDPVAIRATISDLDHAFDGVQALVADVGARDKGLDNILTGFDDRTDALTARRRDVAEIPIDEAMLSVTASQTALQAAYLVTSRLQSLSLTEYLR
jgi:flagellar hook-associated protein 3 FlgL